MIIDDDDDVDSLENDIRDPASGQRFESFELSDGFFDYDPNETFQFPEGEEEDRLWEQALLAAEEPSPFEDFSAASAAANTQQQRQRTSVTTASAEPRRKRGGPVTADGNKPASKRPEIIIIDDSD